MTDPTPGEPPPRADHRWPRQVYGHGSEPDPRFSFANERTFLAWIRTSLGLLTAGVAVVALAGLQPRLSTEAHVASLILILAGMGCAVTSLVRWGRTERALRENRPMPSSTVLPVLVLLLVLVGLVALFVLVP